MNIPMAAHDQAVHRMMQLHACQVLANVLLSYKGNTVRAERLLQDIDYACGGNEQLKTEVLIIAAAAAKKIG
jgi:hypothetical protein